MAGLRVVPVGDVPPASDPVTMGEAVVALAAQIASTDPTLVLVVYEHPAGKLNIRTVPDSPYVAEVLAARVYDMLHPEADAE